MSIKKEITKGALSLAALAVGTDAALAQDWAGNYAGLSLTSNNGATPAHFDGDDYKLGKNGVAGAFVGKRWDVGSAVMGAELDISGSGLQADLLNNGDTYSMGTFVDSKVSVGVPLGKALLYGFAGLSASTVNGDGEKYSAWGTNMGVGVDYMVTDKMSVGAEVMRRSFKNSYGSNGSSDGSTAVSVRVAFHF